MKGRGSKFKKITSSFIKLFRDYGAKKDMKNLKRIMAANDKEKE